MYFARQEAGSAASRPAPARAAERRRNRAQQGATGRSDVDPLRPCSLRETRTGSMYTRGACIHAPGAPERLLPMLWAPCVYRPRRRSGRLAKTLRIRRRTGRTADFEQAREASQANAGEVI